MTGNLASDEKCPLVGDVIHCCCGNPSSHYGTMGERGAREVREVPAIVRVEAWFNEICPRCKCEGLIGDCPTSLRAKIREMLSVETEVDSRDVLIAALTQWANDWSIAIRPGEQPIDKGWRFAAEDVKAIITKSAKAQKE